MLFIMKSSIKQTVYFFFKEKGDLKKIIIKEVIIIPPILGWKTKEKE